MNGYFQRLMARNFGSGTGVHPLSRLPHTGLPEAEPLIASEGLPEAPHAGEEPHATGRAESYAAAAEPIPSSLPPGALMRAPAARMSNAATAANPAVANASPTVPSLARARTSEENSASAQRPASAMPGAHASEPKRPPPARTAERFADEAPEVFRLMAPASSAHAAGPSWPAPPVSPETGVGRVQAANLALQTGPGVRRQSFGQAKPEAAEVHVSIGRIEITAVQAPAPRKGKPPAGRKPMSLDDYLAKRGRA